MIQSARIVTNIGPVLNDCHAPTHDTLWVSSKKTSPRRRDKIKWLVSALVFSARNKSACHRLKISKLFVECSPGIDHSDFFLNMLTWSNWMALSVLGLLGYGLLYPGPRGFSCFFTGWESCETAAKRLTRVGSRSSLMQWEMKKNLRDQGRFTTALSDETNRVCHSCFKPHNGHCVL